MSLSPRCRHLEHGAVSTIVVVLLSAGVLLGFVALTADFGRTVLERRELQNGADAGALAFAQSCAEDQESGCDPEGLGLEALVNANADDGEHTISLVCGTAPGLDPCPDAGSIDDIRVCPPVPDFLDGVPYVEVRTRTSSDGEAAIPNIFGSAAGGEATSSVDSCARAVWGTPGSTGTTFPLTIRECNWNAVTQNGTNFAPSPPYTPGPVTPNASPKSAVPAAVAANVTHILAHASGNPSDECGPTKYSPGGFGWLSDGSTADCSAEFSSGGTATGDAGASPTQGCKNNGMKQWLGKEVLIPVFSGLSGAGSNTSYTLAGVSSFYLAGWSEMQTANPGKDYGVYIRPNRLPGSAEDDMCMMLDPPPNQLKKATCIWGWFTSPIVPVGSIDPTSPPRGPTIVQMAG